MVSLFSLSQASWLYPLRVSIITIQPSYPSLRQLTTSTSKQGIIFFICHPFLWPLFRARLFSISLLSAFIYTILFTLTYLPQVAFLAIFQGTGAWVNGLFLVLGEGAAIVQILFEAFFVDETLVDVFDAVLISQGEEDLVATSRTIHPRADQSQGGDGDGDGNGNGDAALSLNPTQRLGKPITSAIYAPFSLRQIVEFIVLLPLNLVPVAGTPMFLILTGYRAGPLQHWRYFEFRGFNKNERKKFVAKRRVRYTWFGTVALILQLVPMLSMFFLLTTAVGSALWATDFERRRRIAIERSEAGRHSGYRTLV
ncbi:hypothetical protein I7I51_00657 [Histoplasma capsulatum]|uniref:Uncharacterized protein n=1 Tax=Ajellomyces capsulatus TaxID=5037 RepID=A0A8A1MAM7_AJECA|nr:predicted protein [Histoplasma mississippiense (nom. inval.)]EDN09000.1 predicted protein [Histoplasma mississippiense (nom. inval.)]QSS63598.1 hypothetical protein I7I51_00657 [Histoplasma capsulatum]